MAQAPPPRDPQPPQNQPAQTPPAQADDAAQEEVGGGGGNRFLVFNAIPSWLVSTVVHAILMVVLALVTLPETKDKNTVAVTVPPEPVTEEVEDFEIEEITEQIDVTTFDSADFSAEVMMVEDPPITDVEMSNDLEVAEAAIELNEFAENTAPKSDLLNEIGATDGSGLTGRGSAMRGKMVGKYGGNEASEAAVAAALKWLAAHQLPNGSWSFNHTVGPGNRSQKHPGSLNNAFNGSTAMGLLPFLGAGQTHQEGAYKKTVYGALDYLVRSIKPSNGGGSYHEPGGRMYSHGLAAIAVCEAYAMTQDKQLLPAAQASLNFIVYAQDPVGGGWRYEPRQAGDTSAVGWQIMALKSGHMAFLQVPPNTVRGAVKFLDAVSAESGAYYGYTSPGRGQATTACGLLCRMYLGWDKENPALGRGVEFLASKGPSGPGSNGRANMYYNYYATQVMRQYGGEKWDEWNKSMRDWLVASQDKEGAEEGSWHFTGDHGAERGGRLYCTSMATMILEVYYRHMPIYKQGAVKEEFPLE